MTSINSYLVTAYHHNVSFYGYVHRCPSPEQAMVAALPTIHSRASIFNAKQPWTTKETSSHQIKSWAFEVETQKMKVCVTQL